MISRELTIRNPKFEEQIYRGVCISITVITPILSKLTLYSHSKFFIIYQFCKRDFLIKYIDDKGKKKIPKEAIPSQRYLVGVLKSEQAGNLPQRHKNG